MLKKFAATGVVTIAAAGALMFAAPASADDYARSQNSILGANQVSVPISVPIVVCGNALGLLGSASAGCGGS
ncbi:chaplin family protein [Actinomadura sp. HBU206391]|uniref:chaplin family protein n=1 Tax=Actinomadura sp. HBU206391 TaxID=2731692 RepID=UPI00164FF9B2|nr:chaplin family protein [Actinomadura sp. HBU206391]MBC6463373.1 DUF320 domain-containing protein [Actinomadura sp. HBU206391]